MNNFSGFLLYFAIIAAGVVIYLYCRNDEHRY